MKINKNIKEGLQILLAIVLASIGLQAFLLPNGFLDGGVTGIAILVSLVTDIEVSILLPVISIPFFIIGYFTITNRILVKSVIAIMLLSIILHFDWLTPITDDKLIIATFGGLFLGAGIGLAIKNGSVLDGSELLGIYINNKFGFSIGSIILGFNIILFGITAVVISTEIGMYSILTYLVTSKTIDFTIQGFENYVGLMIISKKFRAIEVTMAEKLGHGVTIYKGGKGFGKTGTNENKEIIHIIVNRIDVNRINQIIDEIDNSAFVIEFDVNSVRGGKIKKYLT